MYNKSPYQTVPVSQADLDLCCSNISLQHPFSCSRFGLKTTLVTTRMSVELNTELSLFEFYNLVNTVKAMSSQSVYLLTLFLGKLSHLNYCPFDITWKEVFCLAFYFK